MGLKLTHILLIISMFKKLVDKTKKVVADVKVGIDNAQAGKKLLDEGGDGMKLKLVAKKASRDAVTQDTNFVQSLAQVIIDYKDASTKMQVAAGLPSGEEKAFEWLAQVYSTRVVELEIAIGKVNGSQVAAPTITPTEAHAIRILSLQMKAGLHEHVGRTQSSETAIAEADVAPRSSASTDTAEFQGQKGLDRAKERYVNASIGKKMLDEGDEDTMTQLIAKKASLDSTSADRKCIEQLKGLVEAYADAEGKLRNALPQDGGEESPSFSMLASAYELRRRSMMALLTEYAEIPEVVRTHESERDAIRILAAQINIKRVTKNASEAVSGWQAKMSLIQKIKSDQGHEAIEELWKKYDKTDEGFVDTSGRTGKCPVLTELTMYFKQVLREEGNSLHELIADEQIKEWLRKSFGVKTTGRLSKQSFCAGIEWVLRPDSVMESLSDWDNLSGEEKIMALQRNTEGLGTADARSKSKLRAEFASLFEELPKDAMSRVRQQLDSNLCYAQDGIAVDLRTVIFEVVNDVDRKRLLTCIQRASTESCLEKQVSRGPFVLLSDVDDTILPGHDALKISGEDRSWKLDGTLYPGVAQLHRQLRGDGPDGYTVLLTSRPPNMCRSLAEKLSRIVGVASQPRLSILPGANLLQGIGNAANILVSSYENLGDLKKDRFDQYAQLFPEAVGKYVFVGDDGQADFDITREMLKAKCLQTSQHYFAFVAIHAVLQETGMYKIPTREREDRINAMRKSYPSINASEGYFRYRFFYFLNYGDLAEQLRQAGWISRESELAVQSSFEEEKRGFVRDQVSHSVSNDARGSRRPEARGQQDGPVVFNEVRKEVSSGYPGHGKVIESYAHENSSANPSERSVARPPPAAGATVRKMSDSSDDGGLAGWDN